MRRRGAAGLAGGICATSLAIAALTWLLHTKNAAIPLPARSEPVTVSPLFGAGLLMVFCLPGALVVAQRPRNPIGWLLTAIGGGIGGSVLAYEYGFYALVTEPGSLPGGIAAPWLGDSLDLSLTLGPVPLLLLWFPDGKGPSRAWRPVVWVTLAAAGILAITSARFPRNLGGDPRLPRNPLGIPSAEDLLNSVSSLAALLLLGAMLASLYAVGIRFHHATGVERQQLKWFAYGAVALVLTCIGFLPLAWSGNFAPILIGTGFFTTCVAVAVLRYHLYDIDRLINRTLVYGLLTVLLGLGYASAALVFGQLAGQHRSNLVVAGSTLGVAAAFQPARRRVQATVDRRFNRRKYDAAKTVEQFRARLRQEVDLEALTAELLAVVDQTMEPTTVSLWLQPPPAAARRNGMRMGDALVRRPVEPALGRADAGTGTRRGHE